MNRLLILFLLTCSLSLNAQSFLERHDLELDKSRGMVIAAGASIMIDNYTHRPILSAIAGLGLSVGQGLLLERSNSGKWASGWGGCVGALFIFPVWRNMKMERDEKRLARYKETLN